jgi:putative endonuclease
MRGGWVYILASRYRGTLYIGVTANIAARAYQHKTGTGADFTRKYGVTLLVYAEQHATIEEAIAREKALKKWKRDWKFRLIEEGNPDWLDLYDRING